MGNAAAQRRIVDNYVVRFRKAHPLVAAFFFGSRAEGTFDQWSDYDLLIVSPDFRGLDFWQRWALARCYWRARVGADFFCFSPEEYELLQDEISIPGEAVQHGIRVA
ncbi:MAG: nucleotidyltransferase domain-containing protein [Chloroflexi bacterium]|nr:nucleotidyltransferase domain-containing protein [Chloroflexota bacterium]